MVLGTQRSGGAEGESASDGLMAFLNFAVTTFRSLFEKLSFGGQERQVR